MNYRELLKIETDFFRTLKNHCGLSRTDVFILISCRAFNQETYYDLTNSIDFDNSLISRRVKDLERRGYIERHDCRNKKIIRLTKKSEVVFNLFENVTEQKN